jgi:broad specificity phosphatase PhoE
MPIIITYFPHGATEDNEKGISSGWSDPPLSEKGKQQALELKERIKEREFDIVFCSDLKRALETAKLCFDNGMPIVEDKRLRECNYGKLNGAPSATVEPLQALHIKERFEGGECYEDVRERIFGFLEFLKQNHENGSVAVISHKAPQLILDVLLKGKTWEQAFAEDWRKQGAWQPGWEYILE